MDAELECVDHALDHAPPAVYHAHLLCLAGFVDVWRGEVDRAEWALTRAREPADTPFIQDPLQLPRLEAEVRWAQGRVDEAAAVVRAAFDLPHARIASRFSWPLAALGGGAGRRFGRDAVARTSWCPTRWWACRRGRSAWCCWR